MRASDLSSRQRVRGRHGQASYTVYHHARVREALIQHRKTRKRGYRAIANKLLDMEVEGGLADEEIDKISHEAIHAFCKHGRFISNTLMNLIELYLEREEPDLVRLISESGQRERIGQSLIAFYGVDGTTIQERAAQNESGLSFGKGGIYVSHPLQNLSLEEWPREIRKSPSLLVLKIDEVQDQRYRLAWMFPIRNPAFSVDPFVSGVLAEDIMPPQQVGYCIPTTMGDVLFMQRPIDRLPVIVYCERYEAQYGYCTYSYSPNTSEDRFLITSKVRHGWLALNESFKPGGKIYNRIAEMADAHAARIPLG